MSSSSAEYVPTGVERVRAWQVDLGNLGEAWELLKVLYEDYDAPLRFTAVGGKHSLLIVQDPYNVHVEHLDWVVCGDVVKKMTDAEFHRSFKKAGEGA